MLAANTRKVTMSPWFSSVAMTFRAGSTTTIDTFSSLSASRGPRPSASIDSPSSTAPVVYLPTVAAPDTPLRCGCPPQKVGAKRGGASRKSTADSLMR